MLLSFRVVDNVLEDMVDLLFHTSNEEIIEGTDWGVKAKIMIVIIEGALLLVLLSNQDVCKHGIDSSKVNHEVLLLVVSTEI